MLHGLATMWDKEGTITSQIKYENGKQVEEVK
jgi:antitoxin component YwqK of YwqJK toxin-antitoxin module